jgi:hypothetical protein
MQQKVQYCHQGEGPYETKKSVPWVYQHSWADNKRGQRMFDDLFTVDDTAFHGIHDKSCHRFRAGLGFQFVSYGFHGTG